MKIHTLATTAVMASASVATAKKNIIGARHRNKFVKAMQTSHEARSATLTKDQTPSLETFADTISGDSKRARQLRKKVISKAKRVEHVKDGQSDRDLQNNNYNDNNYNSAYQANSNSNNDNTDDYFRTNGEWDNTFGFDVTQYSLSYHRCAAVRQFDDELAANEDSTSVFSTNSFAVFRFCPSSTCEGVRPDETEEQWQAAQEEYNEDYNNGNNQYNQYAWEESESYQSQPVQYNGQVITQGEFDLLSVMGANGDGCQNNYGEYMLELEDYLAIMVDYHEERFEKYCETCEDCMYEVYQEWIQNGAQEYNNRKLKAKSDATWQDDLQSEDFKKATERELGGFDAYHICPEYDTCRYYKDSCDHGVDDSLSRYFECVEVETSNGQEVWIGPHCASDGITITLGVYGDEYCNEFIGNGVNIANILGYVLEGDELANFVTGSLSDVIPAEAIQAQKLRYSQNYDADLAEYYTPIDQMCIPCMASRQPYEERGQGVYDYADNSSDGDNEINELCENLYQVSARCDKHYRSYSTMASLAAYAEAVAREDLSCEFIDSIVMGNYDEFGFINGDTLNNYNSEAKSGVFSNSMYAEEYGHLVSDINGAQYAMLAIALIACSVLGLWAYDLNHSLKNNGKRWVPQRFRQAPSILKRGNSGVTTARSEVEPAAASEISDRNQSYYMS